MDLPSTNSGQDSLFLSEQMPSVPHKKSYNAMSKQIITWLPRFEGNDTENPMEGMFQRLDITSETKRVEYIVRARNPDLALQLKEVHKTTTTCPCNCNPRNFAVDITQALARYLHPARRVLSQPSLLAPPYAKLRAHTLLSPRANCPLLHPLLWLAGQAHFSYAQATPAGTDTVAPSFDPAAQAKLNKKTVENATCCLVHAGMLRWADVNADPRAIMAALAGLGAAAAGDHIVVVVVAGARDVAYTLIAPFERMLSLDLAARFSRWLVRALPIYAAISVAGAEASVPGEALNYAVEQVGANSVVLAFGALVGSGSPQPPATGYCTGPLGAVNRASWLFGLRSRWQREYGDGTPLVIGTDTLATEEVLGKRSIPLLVNALMPALIWGITLGFGLTAPSVCLTGIAYGLFDGALAVATVKAHAWLDRGTLSCLASWYGHDNEVPPPPDHDNDPDSYMALARAARDVRDFVIEHIDGQYRTRPSGASLSVAVPGVDKRAGLVLLRVGAGLPLIARWLLGVLEVLNVVWWLILMAMPSVVDCSWWTVFALYGLAAFARQREDVPYSVAEWVPQRNLTQSQEMLRRSKGHSLLGAYWSDDVKMQVGADAVYGCGCTSGVLRDKYTIGPKVELGQGVRSTLMEVWQACLKIDASQFIILTPTAVKERQSLHSFAYTSCRIVTSIINLGIHASTCPCQVSMSDRHITAATSSRYILCLLGAKHTCEAVRHDKQVICEALEDNPMLLAWYAREEWAGLDEGAERATFEMASSYPELVHMLLNAVTFATEQQDYAVCAVATLYNIFRSSGMAETHLGPASAMISAWEDGVTVEVDVRGGLPALCVEQQRIEFGIDVADREKWDGLEMIDIGYIGREGRSLLRFIEEQKLRLGMSQALVAPPTPGRFPWATLKVQAAGSAFRTAEESRNRRSLAIAEARALRKSVT